MSVTILSEPITPLESYTHHIWTVSSNLSNIRQIQAVIEKDSADVFALNVQSSFGSSSVFDIDLQEWLRDQLSYDIQEPDAIATAYTAPNSSYEYDNIKFFEYVDVDGKLELAGGNNSPTPKLTLNAARQTFNSAGLTGYQIQSPTGSPWTYDKFLTNAPILPNTEREVPIQEDESYTLSLYAKASTTNAIVVVWQDIEGNQLRLDRIDFTGTAGRYDICVGLANLAAAGITPPTGATRYYVWVANYSAPTYIRQSEFFFFRIDTKCEGTRVHFLNRWGGFDSFTLNKKRRVTSTRSTTYEKYLNAGYTPQDRGRQNQSREATVSYRASTNLISDTQAIWLEELITSPAVYVEENKVLIPVTVDDGSQIITSNEVPEFELFFTLANDLHIQRL
jgi:hypothetical protein